MKKYVERHHSFWIPIFLSILIAGCGGGGGDDTTTTSNNTPIADAGIAQTISQDQLVTLDGSGSYDSDGDTLTYSWSQVSGAPITLDNPTSVSPTFDSPDSGGDVVIELIVNDGTIDSAPSQVTITFTYVDATIAHFSDSSLQRIFADPVRPAIYITDALQNLVHVFETTNNTLVTSIPVGSQPTKMDMNVNADSLFVMNSGGNTISVIDPDMLRVKYTLTLPGTPDAIAVSSSEHLYVSMDNYTTPEIVGYNISTLPYTQSFTSTDALIIMGRDDSHARMYMHDWSTSLTARLWDITISPPVELGIGDVSSGATTVTPIHATDLVFISPALEYWDTRWPNYGGDVPIFNGLVRVATLNVEWDPIATASNFQGTELAVAHTNMVTNPVIPVEDMHDPVPDLHLFNGATFAQLEILVLSDYVLHNGLSYAANGDIYFLKGAGVLTSLAYIDR
jgi:hypothetical protein